MSENWGIGTFTILGGDLINFRNWYNQLIISVSF